MGRLIMSEKAHFHLCGNVNTPQSCCYWAIENPKENFQKPMQSEKVTVWCSVAYFGLIGPYFFENENGETVTVTNESYTSMI